MGGFFYSMIGSKGTVMKGSGLQTGGFGLVVEFHRGGFATIGLCGL